MTSSAGAVAKCDGEYVCVCVCVCLSVYPRGYHRNHIRDLYQIFVCLLHMAVSVLLQRSCDTLCTSGFVDDIMFFYNGPYNVWILLRRTDFAEIYYFTAKSDIIQIPIIKGHNSD